MASELPKCWYEPAFPKPDDESARAQGDFVMPWWNGLTIGQYATIQAMQSMVQAIYSAMLAGRLAMSCAELQEQLPRDARALARATLLELERQSDGE